MPAQKARKAAGGKRKYPAASLRAADAAVAPPAGIVQIAPANTGPPKAGLDFEKLSQNMARLVEVGGKAAAAMLQPMESGQIQPSRSSEIADLVKTFGHVAEYWMSDPSRAIEAQTSLSSGFFDLWSHTLRRMSGEDVAPVAPPDAGDKRFAEPEWRESPVFDFLAQAYTLTNTWAKSLVDGAQTVDPHTRHKADFYLRQISAALSPSNFVATNPRLLADTLEQNGENLVRGMTLLTEDIEAGHGTLRMRQSDNSKFELGVNMATTPGKVVFRNEIMELLQYTPSTPQVLKRPLLIVPPWINKFYILDLNADKSFIRWAVGQGLTVFVISWVNPDERHRNKSFEDYARDGILAACDAIALATGEKQVSVVGYCVGGTLVAVTLAWLAAHGDQRIACATLFTTQVDFSDPGDLKVFVDEQQVAETEAEMAKRGYLDGSKMANAFNMLRPNDLIWSYAVNNYVKGKAPGPFDLLTWNSDSTRMPAANHSFYLRNCYLNNTLTRGKMVLGTTPLDLSKVTVPIYNLAAREDHIAPASSVFRGAQFFGGEMTYVLAGSGHIAGVINPPAKAKYQYWLGPSPKGEFEDWLPQATEHLGSWWPHWLEWLTRQAPEKVAARQPGSGKLPVLGDAPGTYVRVKA